MDHIKALQPLRAGAAHRTLHYNVTSGKALQCEDIAKMTVSRIALTERGPGAK